MLIHALAAEPNPLCKRSAPLFINAQNVNLEIHYIDALRIGLRNIVAHDLAVEMLQFSDRVLNELLA
jgi:hypothetical protein